MTTERPSAPKFDMGNPKDEDKGSPDDGDKKKKKTKDKKGASTNEQVLQAQALFDCAGACACGAHFYEQKFGLAVMSCVLPPRLTPYISTELIVFRCAHCDYFRSCVM